MEAKPRIIPIRTTYKNVFREYLMISKPLYEAYLYQKNGRKKNRKGEPIKITLISNEIKVLSSIIYYYFKYREEKGDGVWKYILGRDVREEIRHDLDMDQFVLNNNILALRQKNVIIDRYRLDPFFIIEPRDNDLTLTFKFIIK